MVVKVDSLAVELAKKFIAYLQNQGIKIDSAYLFGSFAKGTEHKWSDIDVAVISSDFSKFKSTARCNPGMHQQKSLGTSF